MAHTPTSPSPNPTNSRPSGRGHGVGAATRPRHNLRLLALLGFTLACSKSTPPPVEAPASAPSSAVEYNDSVAAPIAETTSVIGTEKGAEREPSTDSATATSGAASTINELAQVAVPVLTDANGNPLPQTEERPTIDSPSFKHRLELLVSAIATDQPDSATAAFFPQIAYAQVKAIKDPNRDWERRLLAAFARNIHEYHQQLGSDAQSVRLIRLELPEAKVKWMKPGAEGNRVGYYRVTRSKLVVAKADGKEVSFELTSLISWRGEWYVVHLHGFE